MKQLFNYIKDNLLRGMPSGSLVTAYPIDFDIEFWQHRPYWDNNSIKHHLNLSWCSSTINIMILDDTIRQDQIETFMDDVDFEKYNRNIYLIYFLCIPKIKVNADTERLLKCKSLNINRFSQKLEFENYWIFVNDFVKNILKLNE